MTNFPTALSFVLITASQIPAQEAAMQQLADRPPLRSDCGTAGDEPYSVPTSSTSVTDGSVYASLRAQAEARVAQVVEGASSKQEVMDRLLALIDSNQAEIEKWMS